MASAINIGINRKESDLAKAHLDQPYLRYDEIESLVRSFEDCTLPRGEWTHRAHLTVALWYMILYAEKEATERIRDGIRRYNNAQAIKTTKEGGYHETMTLFWIRMVRKFLLSASWNRSVVVLANRLIDRLGDKQLPFTYYSRDRLMSPEARAGWVEPDLKPLD